MEVSNNIIEEDKAPWINKSVMRKNMSCPVVDMSRKSNEMVSQRSLLGIRKCSFLKNTLIKSMFKKFPGGGMDSPHLKVDESVRVYLKRYNSR